MLPLRYNIVNQDQTRHRVFKYIRFILCVVVINIIISLFFAYISDRYFNNILAKNSNQWDSITEEFIIAIILAPFIETLLFQAATYKVIRYVLNFTNLTETAQNYLFIGFSSLLFAYSHTYNWLYVISAFLGGLFLNYSYTYFKKEKFYPYLAVVSIHLLYNLIGFALKRL